MGTKPYETENRGMFIYLVAMAAACAFGFQGWRTMITNFAVEVVGINGQQMGMIQGLREIPGFLSFGVIYVLLIVKEHRLGALSLIFMGLGICSAGLLPSYWGLILSTMAMSFGFHYYETVNQSLTLQHFSKLQVPLVLGRVRSTQALANIIVVASVFLLTMVLDYKPVFIIVGGVTALVAVCFIFKDPTPRFAKAQKKSVILRKRYWLFYSLTFMGGARRMIFAAFALFLMVEKFGFTVQEMAALFLFNNIVNWFTAPLVGKAINKFGERVTLTFEYTGLFIVFMLYATSDYKPLITVIYVVDHLMYNFYISIPSYFHKIAKPSEVAPSMAVGFAINHIVAVLIPIVGGIIWMIDYRICFFAGAFFALISLTLSQFTGRKRLERLRAEWIAAGEEMPTI